MHSHLRYARNHAIRGECGEIAIQQFMMRLSSNLRRFRWLVFTCWLLALVPAVYLALTESNHLTGGGFDVAGSQSLHVQYQLEDHYPQQGASPLALVAAPRADASYSDMNTAVARLEEAAKQVPSVVVVPNPGQPAPAPDRPYVVSLRLDFNNTGAVDVARQLRQKIGVTGDTITAPDAERLGLVNFVVDGDVESAAVELAQRLAQGNQRAIRASKVAVNAQARAAASWVVPYGLVAGQVSEHHTHNWPTPE